MKIERITDLERQYAMQSLDGQFETHNNYKFVVRLEKAFAEKIGTKHAVGFVNGTATLHTALEAAGVTMGDEVIVPPLTMSSTSLAVIQANAIPVFADVDEKTFLISASDIEKKITPATKAIVAVHMRGVPCNMDRIMEIVKKHNLRLIEDVAQAVGGTYKGKYLGTFGDCGCLSFQYHKVITAGEGGMILCKDARIYDRCCSYHDTAACWRPDRFAEQRFEGELFCGYEYVINRKYDGSQSEIRYSCCHPCGLFCPCADRKQGAKSFLLRHSAAIQTAHRLQCGR